MLKPGYGWAIVQENILSLVAGGTPRLFAVREAMAFARVSFFKKNKNGVLSHWLADPYNYKLRTHYNADGTPKFGVHAKRSVRAEVFAGTRRNPSAAPDKKNIQRAVNLYRDFTGKEPQSLKRFAIPATPKEGLVFGELKGIHYVSARDGGDYYHRFRKNSRPSLIATFDGKSVLIVGGRYAFTERGIEDR